MGKLLTAFADDNLCVNPTLYEGSPAYRKAVAVAEETYEALSEKLNSEEKELFERFADAQEDENCLYQLDVFSRGFRIAVLLLFEVFAAGTDEFMIEKRTRE